MPIKRMPKLTSFETVLPQLKRFKSSDDGIKNALKERYYKLDADIASSNNKWEDVQSWNKETDSKYRDGSSGSSSLVDTVEYNDDDHTLSIKYRPSFYGGETIIYEDVPREVFDGLTHSDSKGRYTMKEVWDYKWHKA